ncbi:hypothetical protein GCM10020254_13260 [Streptomyces goshikiensis]
MVTAVGEPVLVALLLGKAAQAHERGVELVVTPDSSVIDGRTGIPPARDLVDNAVDALSGVPGGRVMVTVRAEGDGLLIRVADNGPGLPEGADVFRRGWSGKGEGRGLGLALVRQVAHRHGGSADAGARAEGGAEFTVRLPTRGEAGA